MAADWFLYDDPRDGPIVTQKCKDPERMIDKTPYPDKAAAVGAMRQRLGLDGARRYQITHITPDGDERKVHVVGAGKVGSSVKSLLRQGTCVAVEVYFENGASVEYKMAPDAA